MSVTTTDNARLTAVRHVLADYELHHSQPSPSEAAEAPAPNERQEVQSTPAPPGDWETQWNRVPAYRPVNPALLEGDRNTYNNAIERNFIRVMFGGVWLQAVSWTCRRVPENRDTD